jgi:hypothetical protein
MMAPARPVDLSANEVRDVVVSRNFAGVADRPFHLAVFRD